MKDSKSYFRGCLLGGAIGDALSYPVESLNTDEIKQAFGDTGIRSLICNDSSGKALVSDETQMTIFTVDGLLWADSRAKNKGVYAYIPCIFYAYQKWFYTQTGHFADKDYEFLLKGEVLQWEELFARRTPGETVLKALEGSIKNKYGTLRNRVNNSKGYAAVARSAPIGMYFFQDPKKAFQIGYESAALTHGHSDAFLSAGFFAHLIALIFRGEELESAVLSSLALLKRYKNSDTTYETIHKAVQLVKSDVVSENALSQLGDGWVAEEALAKAIYCSLKYPKDFEKAVCLAANQNGNSNGPTSICGNILGSYLGSLEIPYLVD
jgi:ADP-ribosylglycohydrolase